MPQYLYRIQPVRLEMLTEGPTEAEAETLARHVAYLESQTEHGRVILAGRTQTADPDTFGIVIFEAEDDAAAEAVMKDDPAVADGVMHAKLFPYRIAVSRS